MFFFEKKNQKTFTHWLSETWPERSGEAKIFIASRDSLACSPYRQ